MGGTGRSSKLRINRKSSLWRGGSWKNGNGGHTCARRADRSTRWWRKRRSSPVPQVSGKPKARLAEMFSPPSTPNMSRDRPLSRRPNMARPDREKIKRNHLLLSGHVECSPFVCLVLVANCNWIAAEQCERRRGKSVYAGNVRFANGSPAKWTVRRLENNKKLLHNSRQPRNETKIVQSVGAVGLERADRAAGSEFRYWSMEEKAFVAHLGGINRIRTRPCWPRLTTFHCWRL